MYTKIIITGLIFCLSGFASFAQKDTTKKQTIDITSSYKPVLRNAVKINFSAANLNADSSRPYLTYTIPPQNLFYTYQPMSLKPLALIQDTTMDLGARNFIKVGFGNYTTPFVSAGFSFGDGKKSLVNLYANYISSKGKIQYQDYSQFNARVSGSFFTARNEVYGSAGFSQDKYYLYGYNHADYTYTKAELLQQFSDIKLKVGFKNKDVNGTGINYNPNIEINIFSNQNKLTENSFIAEAPLEKIINDVLSVKLALKADMTRYSTEGYIPNNFKVHNDIYAIAPELVYTQPLLSVHVGITPTWDNGDLSVLPNIYAEAQIADKPLLVQAGWIGRFIKNTYQNLSMINPYLGTLTTQLNTKEIEVYGGLKASVSKHFNFSATASFISYDNFPFFINDTAAGASGNTFKISNDSKVSDFRFHADMSFISQDKFTITGGITYNGYTGLQGNNKAWGMIPLQLNASMRWWAYKQVLIKSDFMTFSSTQYLLPGNISRSLKGGADLSAGVEVVITPKISAWFDINNIFNDKYQRWYNYEVYGINFLAGVIFKF
jgi:hypothetical protein